MFVIEKLLNDLDSKEEAWEDAREKWVAEGDDGDGYNYRSESDYRHKYGMSPKSKVRFLYKHIFIAIFSGLIMFCVINVINVEVNQPPEPVKASSEYKNNDECGKFHIGDIASVNYGDYDGAEVEIIGGCEDHAEYETKVTKDQTLNAEGSENEEYNDKPISKGLIIKVNESDNLTKTGHIEEKK